MKNFKLPIAIKLVIAFFVLGMIYSLISSMYKSTTTFYNQTVNYSAEYKALIDNQVTTYDNYYLVFTEKSKIANINKETFITVTNIIMQSRKDGENLSWKWIHENQNIPYEEFTKFYAELSSFTGERFAENNKLERQKQDVVKTHNILISTFPGVIYNHFLKIQPLIYQKGFVSEETKKLFKL